MVSSNCLSLFWAWLVWFVDQGPTSTCREMSLRLFATQLLCKKRKPHDMYRFCADLAFPDLLAKH
jgi:hypothetical protein